MSDFDNDIPGGEWLEYDAAAAWCVARGIRGAINDPLRPMYTGNPKPAAISALDRLRRFLNARKISSISIHKPCNQIVGTKRQVFWNRPSGLLK